MIHPTIQGFDVNFHYSFENEYAELISYEPFEGKFVVIPKNVRRKYGCVFQNIGKKQNYRYFLKVRRYYLK